MPRDLGIASRLRSAGLRVVEVAGWQTRGSATFNPRGSVNHHTAGAATGNAPSLTTCIYGRPGLPGPLCQVLMARDLTCYVIAAGRANHAGAGNWAGLTGNSSVYGLEIEHTGYGPSGAQLRAAVRVHAALLGPQGNAGLVCQHFEWATPRGRKIDFRSLAPDYTAAGFRTAVAGLLRAPALRPPAPPAPKPPPAPPIEEDDDMLIIIKGDKSPAWWLSTNLVTKRHARTAQQVAEAVFLTVAAGGKVSMRPGNQPHVLPQSSVDSIPTVGAEGPRDHATELRVIDIRNELDKITDEVRAWQAAVEAG